MRTRRDVIVRLWQIVLGLTVLTVWQVLTTAGLVDAFFVSRPSDIFVRMWRWIASGYVLMHLAVTVEEALLGFVMGAALGVTAGFVLGRRPRLSRVVDPYIRILNALPRVVLGPIFLLWFGLGIWSKVALGVTLVFFIVFFDTYRGVRDVERVFVNNALMLGASERQLVRHVLVPSALSSILSSLHVSLGFAMVGAVVGEYLGASRGIGYLISQAEGTFDTTGVFAGMGILSLVVVIVGEAVIRLENRLLRWRVAP